MRKIKLGRTGLEASEVGFGALPIQRVSAKEAEEILLTAYEHGVNFYDTANYYTDSEEKLGNSLSHVRDKIIIATKSMLYDPKTDLETVKKNLDNSLRMLKTDYIDIYQMHDPDYHPGEDVLEYLEKMRDAGKIRFIGLTSHKMQLSHEALDTGFYDTLQFPFCLLSRDGEHELVARCEKENIGFIAMKALSGGLITDTEAAYAYIARYKNVLPIFGVQKKSEILDFLRYAANPPVYDEEMEERVKKQRSELQGSFCRGCGYCQPCPVGIEIWQCARISFLIGRAPYAPYISDKWRAEMDKIKSCKNCGLCASRCPYGLDTPKLLREELARYDELYEKLR